MKTLALALAASIAATSAFAQTTTVIERETPGSSTTIVREREVGPDTTVVRRSESTGSVGCESRSVTRTNEVGDTKTKTTTDC